MPEAIGPRMYLVGRILSALLSGSDAGHPEYNNIAIIEAIRLADLTLDAMNQSDGKPKSA